MTLTEYLSSFPEFLLGKRAVKITTATLPVIIPIKKLVKYISRGETNSLNKLSVKRSYLFTMFLLRIRRAFGSNVSCNGNYLRFEKSVTVKDWHSWTHSSEPGWGKGGISRNPLEIKDSIKRIFDYIIKYDESKISARTLSLVTMGVNAALLKSADIRYSPEPWQTYQELFKQLGLRATVTEVGKEKIKKRLKPASNQYSRDLTPFNKTYVTVEYKNIAEVEKAKEFLIKRKMLGGRFKKYDPPLETVDAKTFTPEMKERVEDYIQAAKSDSAFLRKLATSYIGKEETVKIMEEELEITKSTILNQNDTIKKFEEQLGL
jgi:hypothetical protein